jgi:hypothetical protein
MSFHFNETMKSQIDSELACRFCKHYSPEGRRGGVCQVLNVPVQGKWGACSQMALSLNEPQKHQLIELPQPQPVVSPATLQPSSYPISA